MVQRLFVHLIPVDGGRIMSLLYLRLVSGTSCSARISHLLGQVRLRSLRKIPQQVKPRNFADLFTAGGRHLYVH